MALKKLGVKFSHEFASEIDQNCRKTIRANCKPKVLYEDMKKRNIEQVPDIDLYVCGFPCQPFSSLRSINLQDKTKRDDRKDMVKHCYEVIENKLPAAFVLENVPALLSAQSGRRFKAILSRLRKSGM